MATKEIDERELGLYQQAKQLLDGLYSDPDSGVEFKKMLKKKFPQLSIPEIDAIKPQEEAFEAIKKEWKEWKEKQADDKLEADYAKRFEDVRREFGFTDQGMDELKKRMTKDGIADPRAAAALVVHETPKPIEPTTFGTNRWDFLGSSNKEELEDIRALVNDPDGWLDRQIPKVIAEERNKARLPVTI